MSSFRTNTPHNNRHRRIGRKVLLADRLARSLNRSASPAGRWDWLKRNKRYAVAASIGLFVVVTVGVSVTQFYSNQTAASEKIATEKLEAETRQKDIAADACRQKKAQDKADLIGKVTYDELYDGNECDK